MGLFDIFKTDQQKIKDHIPSSMAELKHLITICGPDAGPTAALRKLANNAAIIRVGNNYDAFSDASDSSILRLDKFERSLIRISKQLEPKWWADRACYMGMKESGSIKGGPDVPGLWDDDMNAFIRQYYTPNVE
jgi:hypothetical protein